MAEKEIFLCCLLHIKSLSQGPDEPCSEHDVHSQL